MKMGFGYKKYNSYRKRAYTYSKTKRREYAEQMEELENNFDELKGWELSSMKDSAYKQTPNYTIRLSNHSADNSYHDIYNGDILLLNIKASKLDFINVINNKLSDVTKIVDTLDLSNYRFINVLNGRIDCYLKDYKTKKDVFKLN